MSNTAHHCAKCRVDAVCDVVAPFEPGSETVFAVAWKCPRCDGQSLVVSPLGPVLAPGPTACLQCGHDGVPDGQTCPNCGMNIFEVLGPEEAIRSDDVLLESAREDFARGTCRRGLTLVNHVLRRNPRSTEAWLIKAQFFEHLGFRNALKAATQEAARLTGGGGPADRDKRWWEFWK